MLDRPDLAKHLAFMYEPRKVPVVLSPEEVARLLGAAPSVKYKAAPSVAYLSPLRKTEWWSTPSAHSGGPEAVLAYLLR
jgi:integrase/recombinase XerD